MQRRIVSPPRPVSSFALPRRSIGRQRGWATTLLIVGLCMGAAGCFGGKDAKPKQSVATQTETEFKEKWVQKRVAEIIAAGETTNGMIARKQALAEFDARFPYAQPGPKNR